MWWFHPPLGMCMIWFKTKQPSLLLEFFCHDIDAKSPSSRMSLIMFLLTWTYIITMWGLIATKAIIKFGLITKKFLPINSLATTYCLNRKKFWKVDPMWKYAYFPIVSLFPPKLKTFWHSLFSKQLDLGFQRLSWNS